MLAISFSVTSTAPAPRRPRVAAPRKEPEYHAGLFGEALRLPPRPRLQELLVVAAASAPVASAAATAAAALPRDSRRLPPLAPATRTPAAAASEAAASQAGASLARPPQLGDPQPHPPAPRPACSVLHARQRRRPRATSCSTLAAYGR